MFKGKIKYICLKKKLLSRVIAWYHNYLAHPGEKRTEENTMIVISLTSLRPHVRTFFFFKRTTGNVSLVRKHADKRHLTTKEQCIHHRIAEFITMEAFNNNNNIWL